MEILNCCKFAGAWTALATPFLNGEVNYADLKNLVRYQIDGNIDGILSVGTSGESPTLTHREHIEVIAKTVEFAKEFSKENNPVPILAGTGSNSTEEAVQLTKDAERVGADGFLLVAPYYNKPSQEGVFRHFAKIAEATQKPIMLYSIPGRCGIEISVETTLRLRQAFPHIIGIKEAGGKVEKVIQTVAALDKDFIVMCGDDSLTLEFMEAGAKGVISVASNWLPKEVTEMVAEKAKGNHEAALKLHQKMEDIFKKFFIEPNPVPVKFALAREKIIQSPEVRLPLCEMTLEHQSIVAEAMDKLKV